MEQVLRFPLSKHHTFIKDRIIKGLFTLTLSCCFRLLEVNGHRVLHLSDPELLQILKQSKVPTKMVILRDIHTSPSQSSDLTEDLCSMKDDLALAMLEVESTQEENQDLLAEVARYDHFLQSNTENKHF